MSRRSDPSGIEHGDAVTADGDARHDIQIQGRYLPDPSLRYATVRFAGPSAWTVLLAGVTVLLGVALIVAVPAAVVLKHLSSPWLVSILLGAGAFQQSQRWLRRVAAECLEWFFLWRRVHTIDLGIDRAVPQPATRMRYEVHFAARQAVGFSALHIRLVFWERWNSRHRMPWIDFVYHRNARRGHDLVRHEFGAVELKKGQHIVVRGSLLIPATRPNEHHRSERLHMSYVNLTTSVQWGGESEPSRGTAPHLITFPWM